MIQNSNKHPLNAREAAYCAVLSSLREESFAADFLEEWQKSNPSPADFRLAQEIAYGTIRMALALDHQALLLAGRKKLSLKPKEKALLRIALYQYYYMSRIPLYALGNETAKMARKYCHETFAGFLNALLRKLPQVPFEIPEGDSLENLSLRYSYPPFLVELLSQDYGLGQAKKIMEAGNQPPRVMFRVRDEDPVPNGVKWIQQANPKVATLTEGISLTQIVESPRYYIQNITPATLLWNFCQRWGRRKPKNVLDLCAAPGGKLLGVHDFLQLERLFANDISPKKVKRLEENWKKYGLEAVLTCSAGETYSSSEKFDLLILDVPCSNTGVLNKRPEARWRCTPTFLKELEKMERKLLQRGKELLSPNGQIWYMTCSLLRRENEEMVAWACKELGYHLLHQETHLPNREGWDGGYGAILEQNSHNESPCR